MKKIKQAFTLIELIVVISILAILWTISFISLNWYSADARDGSRLSDINNIKKSLELYSLKNGKYPLPDNGENVTYGWAVVVWKQWTIWEIVMSEIWKNLPAKPVDPLYGTEYVYSTLENAKEYQIMWLYEWDTIWWILETTYAAANPYVKVYWTYNWLYVKTSNYIFPIPSIITSLDPAWLDLNITTIKSQVIDNGTNIPDMQSDKINVSTWTLNFSDFQVYNWTITNNSSDEDKLAVFKAMSDTYTDSSLVNNGIISTLLSKTTDDEKIALTQTVVLNNPTSVAIVNYTCNDTSKPADNWYITFTEWEPTEENQDYIQDASNCWYVCTWWYTWTNCETAPNPYASCTWVNTPTPFSATTTYGSCNTADIIVCSWNEVWYTIAACNVWTDTASTAYNDAGWYWELFQWWNNAWVKIAWTSTEQISVTDIDSTYSNVTFINDTADWNTTQNDNLWWNWTNTDEARIWPCLPWYHVPSQPEWGWIHTAWWWGIDWFNMSNDLKIPMVGYRARTNANLYDQGNGWSYWSSSPSGTNGYRMTLYTTSIDSNASIARALGAAVRCFKN